MRITVIALTFAFHKFLRPITLWQINSKNTLSGSDSKGSRNTTPVSRDESTMGRMSPHHGTDFDNHAHSVGHIQDCSSIHHSAFTATRQAARSTFQECTCVHVISNRIQFLGATQVPTRAAPMGMAGMGSIKELYQQHV